MSTRIEGRGLVKQYGAAEVIHGIDLTIEPGEFVVFVGPSGCGKSTLLRMIAGLEPISGGDLLIDGERINDVAPADRGIAMVFQSYALYPHMTVFKNLAFGLETAGEPKAVVREKVQRAADILQIGNLLDRKPKQLSGGQRQRVAIGRAIVREPRIFLFDEPLSNLDAELRVQMRVEIAELHAQLKNTMIYVTHDQVEAMTMADKIVILKDGHIMQSGAPLHLYNNPANRFVAGFIGSPSMNFFEVDVLSNDDKGLRLKLDGDTLDLPPREFAASPEGRVTLGIRPEHFSIAPGEGLVRLGSLGVRLYEHLGAQTLVYAETSGGQRATVLTDGQQEKGGKIDSWFDPSNAHFFASDGQRL